VLVHRRARAPRRDDATASNDRGVETALGVARRPSSPRALRDARTRAYDRDAPTRDRRRAMADGSDAEDEDLTAIVEAGEDAVDRSVHPSGIVPVLQCVSARDAPRRASCARRANGASTRRRDEGNARNPSNPIRAFDSKRRTRKMARMGD
jgi:hypothetical protein